MKVKMAILGSLFLIISFLFITTIHASLQDNSDASLQYYRYDNILYVGGSGPNNYTSIQQAINDADNGYTIYVYAGIYHESILINKSISLIGISENGEKPVINTSENKSTVTIIADNCIFRGFTVKSRPDLVDSNPFTGYAACHMNSNNSIIDNNTFMYGEYALYMKRSSYNKIEYNEFFSSYWDGLKISTGTHNIIAHNFAINNSGEGFFFIGNKDSIIMMNTATNNIAGMSLDDSSNCTISDNLIHDNIQYGFTASMSSNLSISNNTVYSHYYGGVYLMDCYNCLVSGNEVHNNGWGISLEGAMRIPWSENKNNLVKRNSVYDNGMGIYLEDSWKSHVIENNLIDNDINA